MSRLISLNSSTTQHERTCLEKVLILFLALALVTVVILSVLLAQSMIIYEGKSIFLTKYPMLELSLYVLKPHLNAYTNARGVPTFTQIRMKEVERKFCLCSRMYAYFS